MGTGGRAGCEPEPNGDEGNPAPAHHPEREAIMRSGLWFSFGLVIAIAVVLVWRYLAGPWIIYLFSRGD